MDMSEYSGQPDGGLLQHNAVARRHFESLHAIKRYVRLGLYDAAHESWEEISQENQIILNRAWTKGGFLTPQERDIAVKGVDKATGWSVWNDRVHSSAE